MTHSIGRDSPASGCNACRACALALMVVLSAASAMAFAATYTVINAQNSGAGSLRQAMLDANASGATTINVTTSGTIVLSDALPMIFSNLDISGNGIIIDGGGAHRCFFVSGLPTAPNGTPQTIAVSLQNLHLNHCRARGGDSGSSAWGGGGGMGAGGSLFVNASASVALNSVDFDGNNVAGSNRGSYQTSSTTPITGGGLGGAGGGPGCPSTVAGCPATLRTSPGNLTGTLATSYQVVKSYLQTGGSAATVGDTICPRP